MYRIRSLLFAAVILGLLALAAFGVRQVITSQEPPQPPSQEEFERRVATADAGARQDIQEFIDSGGDPCSLPVGEFGGHPFPYPDVPTLMNAVDLVVLGQPLGHLLDPPAPWTVASRMLATVQVQDVVAGVGMPGSTVTVDYGHRLSQGTAGLTRASASELDLCSPGEVLLFLERTADPGIYRTGYHGWARIADNTVQAATRNSLFDGYSSAEALVAAVSQIAEAQEARGLPKGRLLCEWKRTSPSWQDPIVCPADTFNPYQAFRLAAPVSEASVIITDPGPSPLGLATADLAPGSPRLAALLQSLDVEVALQPDDVEPDDLISFSVFPVQPVGNTDNFLFEYSPSTGVIRLPHSNGQFPAPPAFVEAMEPFLAPLPGD